MAGSSISRLPRASADLMCVPTGHDRQGNGKRPVHKQEDFCRLDPPRGGSGGCAGLRPAIAERVLGTPD